LCISLRNLSHLRILKITKICLSPSLFRPHLDEHSSPPSWPSLEEIDVKFLPIASNGRWLFERVEFSPRNGTPPSHPDVSPWFRRIYWKVKNAALLDSLYVAAGTAAQQMPRLKRMRLELAQWAGHHTFTFSDFPSTLRLETDPSYTLDPAVIDAWKVRGGQDLGVEIVRMWGYAVGREHRCCWREYG